MKKQVSIFVRQSMIVSFEVGQTLSKSQIQAKAKRLISELRSNVPEVLIEDEAYIPAGSMLIDGVEANDSDIEL